MTSRRNNVRDVMFFAIFTDKERKIKLNVFIYTCNYKKSLRKKLKKNWKPSWREPGWRGIRTRNLENEQPRVVRLTRPPDVVR